MRVGRPLRQDGLGVRRARGVGNNMNSQVNSLRFTKKSSLRKSTLLQYGDEFDEEEGDYMELDGPWTQRQLCPAPVKRDRTRVLPDCGWAVAFVPCDP